MKLKLSNLTDDQKGDILAELRDLRENRIPVTVEQRKRKKATLLL
jgi:hypothetical protein